MPNVPGQVSKPHYHKYGIPCLVCRGMVFRHINFVARVIYFTPLHYFTKAEFRCSRCGARFNAKHTLSDHVIILAFSVLGLFPREGVALYLFCFATWSLLSIVMQFRQADGPIEVYLACVALAISTAVASDQHHAARPRDMTGAETAIFWGAILLGLLLAYGLVRLDRKFTPFLRLKK